MQRPIITIKDELCDGCGACVLSCHEGALEVVNGKARLVHERFCDGLGACLHCPKGALSLEEREAEPFAEKDVPQEKKSAFLGRKLANAQEKRAAHLSVWPIQLRLVPPSAPFLKKAKVSLCAHCTGFALQGELTALLEGTVPVICCPKLEPKEELRSRLCALFCADLNAINVVRMDIPCCGALEDLLGEALVQSGSRITPSTLVVRLP